MTLNATKTNGEMWRWETWRRKKVYCSICLLFDLFFCFLLVCLIGWSVYFGFNFLKFWGVYCKDEGQI